MLQLLLESREERAIKKKPGSAERFWPTVLEQPQEAGVPDCSLISCIWEQRD